MTTLRDRIAEYDRQLQQGRCDMRRRLAENDRWTQHTDGLRDMRHLHRVHQQEETGAMRALGWLFVFISGTALGACLAGWWVGLL